MVFALYEFKTVLVFMTMTTTKQGDTESDRYLLMMVTRALGPEMDHCLYM